MKRLLIVVALAVGFTGSALAQDPAKPDPVPTKAPARPNLDPDNAADDDSADLVPGDPAPDFHLDSSLGHEVRRADLIGRWSVLVFDTGRKAFAGLSAVDDSVRAMGAGLYGVCQDGVGSLVSFAAAQKLAFALLSDPTGEVSQLFGMFDDDEHQIQPGLVIVNEQGIVRRVLQRPSLHPNDVLLMARQTIRGR
ncbi:MAG TPA: peroxiredoxin family protein [Polyangiaceae bacterium]|nr:peroxiredoxin family protein [Polyangiaceae bacterium]